MTHDGSHPPIPLQVAEHLLDLLSSDDAFRELFVRDLASALAQAGLNREAIKAAMMEPSCLKTPYLASKEEISTARVKLLDSLSGTHPHSPHDCFDRPTH